MVCEIEAIAKAWEVAVSFLFDDQVSRTPGRPGGLSVEPAGTQRR